MSPINCSSDTFQQYLITRYLPQLYRDGDYPGIVNLLQYLARFMDELDRDICTLPMTESVFDVPPFLLPFLAELIDATLDTSKSYPQQLLELRKTVNLYKIRSIPYSFYHILKYAGATYYGIIKTLTEMIFLDIFPMDSFYAMEGSQYYNPAIVDIYANIDMTTIYAQLLSLIPAGMKSYFSRLIDFAITDLSTNAVAFVALPQLWFAYGNTIGAPVGFKMIDTNARVSINSTGTAHVNNVVYILDPTAGTLVYLRGALDYAELPITTFSHFWIYKNLVPVGGNPSRSLLPAQVTSPGTLLYTLTPALPIIMNVNQREILQAIITF